MYTLIELIDTLWNVNPLAVIVRPSPAKELIDTLWNVNSYQVSYHIIHDMRINRYIMECKYIKQVTHETDPSKN